MKPVHILLVEDNEGDMLLTTGAFKHGKIINKLSVANDGEEAISFLTKNGKYINEPLPNLLLPDINLPKKNSLEVLQLIKTEANLKQRPVRITTSPNKVDIVSVYKHYANCYISKPDVVNTSLDEISNIKTFRMSIVTLPLKSVVG